MDCDVLAKKIVDFFESLSVEDVQSLVQKVDIRKSDNVQIYDVTMKIPDKMKPVCFEYINGGVSTEDNVNSVYMIVTYHYAYDEKPSGVVTFYDDESADEFFFPDIKSMQSVIDYIVEQYDKENTYMDRIEKIIKNYRNFDLVLEKQDDCWVIGFPVNTLNYPIDLYVYFDGTIEDFINKWYELVQSFNVDDYIDEYSEQAHMNGYSTRELGDDLEDID